jgi:Type IV secretion system pilin
MPKNKKNFIVFFLLIFAGGLFLSVPQVSVAAGFQYQLLEKIPGMEGVSGSDLPKYIEAIYKLALIIVVLSAVLMLSIGGFMYLTSAGNTAALTTAKGVIFDAVIGLVIALAAWLLLNVINPDLVNITIKGLSAIPVTLPPTGATWPDDAKERASLGSNFTYNNPNCKTVGQANCTSMSGSAAIAQLQLLQTNCNCSIKITGGTEFWLHGTNSHHKPGDSAVDIAHGSGIDNYILTEGKVFCSIKGRPVYKVHGALLWDEDSLHWHANFNSSTCDSI